MAWLGLHAHHELVPAAVGKLAEHAGDRLEVDPQFDLPLVERLPRLENERHARPPRRRDREHRRRERLRRRRLRADVRLVAVVLADDDVVELERAARAQHLELLGGDVLGGELERLLHRHQRHHLEQAVLQHVADDAVLIKVAAAPLGGRRLLQDHLRARQVLAGPNSAEALVGEAQHHQIHHELLAQIVVHVVRGRAPQQRELPSSARQLVRSLPNGFSRMKRSRTAGASASAAPLAPSQPHARSWPAIAGYRNGGTAK